jgi:hypothetical protein
MRQTVLLPFLITVLLLPNVGWAQQLDSLQVYQAQIDQANLARQAQTRAALWVLGGWAVGNIGLGLWMQSRTGGPERAFWQMNAGWNAVNLALAGAGLWSAYHDPTSGLALSQSLQEANKLTRILLFNAGLDVGYMALGLYLQERSRRPALTPQRANQFRGWGRSLVLQGGFLLVFDAAFAWLNHRQVARNLHPLLEQLEITPGGLTLHF